MKSLHTAGHVHGSTQRMKQLTITSRSSQWLFEQSWLCKSSEVSVSCIKQMRLWRGEWRWHIAPRHLTWPRTWNCRQWSTCSTLHCTQRQVLFVLNGYFADLASRWRWGFSFTLLPACLWVTSSICALDLRLGDAEGKIASSTTGTRTQDFSSLVTFVPRTPWVILLKFQEKSYWRMHYMYGHAVDSTFYSFHQIHDPAW